MRTIYFPAGPGGGGEGGPCMVRSNAMSNPIETDIILNKKAFQ